MYGLHLEYFSLLMSVTGRQRLGLECETVDVPGGTNCHGPQLAFSGPAIWIRHCNHEFFCLLTEPREYERREIGRKSHVMTVEYNSKVATASFSGFLKLLVR